MLKTTRNAIANADLANNGVSSAHAMPFKTLETREEAESAKLLNTNCEIKGTLQVRRRAAWRKDLII